MPKGVKLFIHHHYDGVESGPAEVCGARGKKKLLRVRFIPFQYATPTYDDVVLAAKDPEFNGHWAFECPGPRGMNEKDLHEQGGRYAMIFEYVRHGTHSGPWFPGRSDIFSSHARVGTNTKPGCVYLAVPKAMRPPSVLEALAAGHPEFEFKLVHPKPRKRSEEPNHPKSGAAIEGHRHRKNQRAR